jgi:hypothetical protein
MFMGMSCIAWANETGVVQSETTGELGSNNQGSANVGSDRQKVVKSFTINGGARNQTIHAASKAPLEASDSGSGGGGGGGVPQTPANPQMVQTTVESVYGQTISIISSDKYFGNAFYLQFTGLDEVGDYTVVLTGEGLGDNGLTGEIVGNSKDSNWNVEEPVRGILFAVPESAIVYGDSRAFYVQVRDRENRELFSAPVEIATKFIQEAGEVSSHDYYGKNEREFLLNAKIPVYIDNVTKLHAYLINSEGKIVAADAQDHLGYQIDWSLHSAKVDQRYFLVFGNFGAYDGGSSERTIGRKWTNIYYALLYKTDDIPAGSYGVQIIAEEDSGKKVTHTISEAITVVDAPIIDYIDPAPAGYPPASVGSAMFYINVSFTGAGKEDLDVVVKDEDGRAMAGPVASKYIWAHDNYCSSVYKMQLQSGIVFEADQEYYIEITRKDKGEIYYVGDDTSVYPIGYFKIHRHVFNNGLDADFTLKAVNANGTSYRLTLRDLYEEVYLSETLVAPTSSTFSVQFYDEDDRLIQLKPDRSYVIKVEAVDGNGFQYLNSYSFDTYAFSEYIPDVITADMKTYLKEADTSLPFDFYISVDEFNVDAAGQFAVAFYPASGEGIIVEGDAVTATLLKKTFGEEGSQLEKDYVRLKGAIPIDDPLQEGIGVIALRYTNRDNEVYTDTLFHISVIKPDKVYADYAVTNGAGYPVFRVWMELLNNFTFDDSNFTILLKDLLGDEKVKSNLILNRGEEQNPSNSTVFKNFTITVPDNLPQGYYIVSVKYDGKDIYDLSNHTQLTFRGWNAFALIDDQAEIVTYWLDDNIRLIGIEVSGVKADSKITAVLYDRSDKENFTPIKTVTLVKGTDEKNVYYYTEQALRGVDLTRSYDIAYFCDNLIMEVDDYREINAAVNPDDGGGGSGGGGGGGGGGGSPDAVNSTTGEASVSPGAGGKISLGSNVSVNIPAGALKGTANANVTIQKASDPPPAPSGFKPLGVVYEFKVGGADNSFNKPVTLTFTFDPDDLTDGETPAVYYYDEDTAQWVNLGGAISGSTITVNVDHFTKFTVLAKEATPSTEQPAPVSAQLFSDVPASFWASHSIYELYGLGVVSGYPDGTFRPDGNITRAEFSVILVKAYKLPFTGANVFDDTAGHWAGDYVGAAYAAGVVSGYSENSFGPDDPITREQMAVLIGKAAGIEAAAPEITFMDSDEISAWAREVLTAVAQSGIMQGYPEGTFYPQRNATRAEAVTVIVNALK